MVFSVAANSVPDRDAEAFFQALVSQQPDMDNVITLDLDPEICYVMQLIPMDVKNPPRFLLRQEYYDLWKTIHSRFVNDQRARRFIITGTAGIGKSLYRYFMIREWIQNRLKLDFESVVFNLEERYFRITPDCKISEISELEFKRSRSSMALLDPCPMLNGHKLLSFKMLIVFSSASPLVGGQNKAGCSLTELLKEAKVLVMNSWTRDELQKIMPQINETRFTQFSYRIGTTRYCIPRWLRYDDDDVEARLADSFTSLALEGVADWFLGGANAEQLKNARMPHRLCVVESKGFGWGISGFLSDYVTKRFSKWLYENAEIDRRRFLQFFSHPFTNGLVGSFYENWAFEALGREKRSLRVQIMDVKENKSAPSKPGRPAKYIIVPAAEPPQSYAGSDLDFFSWLKTDDSMLPENVQLEPNVIYKSSVLNNPSIDGYALFGDDLLMFQATIDKQHSSGLWSDVEHLALSARSIRPRLRIFMVYVVPTDSKLQLPPCDSMREKGVKVCFGTFEDDDFHTAFFESLY